NMSPAGDFAGSPRRSFRLGLCEKRHDREHDSNYESEGYGPKRDPLASRCGFATGNDVFGLQRCRLAVFLSCSFREPSLSRPQIITAQNEAVVPAVCIPLNCTRE